MQEYFQIGTIAGTHGIKGEVRISHATDDPSRFSKLLYIYLSDENVSSPGFNEKALQRYELCGIKMRQKYVLAGFKQITSKEDAEKLKGKRVIIERKDAVKLAEDEHFIADLIGCEVNDKKRGFIGVINDIIPTGSNDVYIVNSEKYGEVLIPAIRDVILEIDIRGKKVRVDLIEGLIDD